MKLPQTSRRRAYVAFALALLVAVAALALAACGGSGTTAQAPSNLPIRTAPVAAYTNPPLATPLPEPTDLHALGETDALEFVPWVDIEVSALGYYDNGGDGLADTHRVAIFDTSRRSTVVIVHVTSDSTLQDGYRYEPLPPGAVLKGGTSYVMAGEVGRDAAPAGRVGLEWAPEIRFVIYRMNTVGWGYPEQKVPGRLYQCMNFLFKPVSAASPSP
jgi:hypothetical protein